MKVLPLALALASLTVIAPAAHAAQRVATFTGTVLSGSGDASLFGVTSLAGYGFTATYVYDDSLGTRQTLADSDTAYGGATFGTANPLISATLTINGQSVDFLSPVFGEASVASAPGSAAFLTDGVDFAGFVAHYRNFDFNVTGALPSSLDVPFSGAVTGGSHFFYQDYFSGPFGGSAIASAVGSLEATHLTIAAVGAGGVPEPASWALLICGFGLAGAALRRSRRGAVA